MTPDALADLITDELRAVARPERAEQEKRYLKSDLDFLGASVWDVRRVVKAFVKGAPPLDHHRLQELVDALWNHPIFERRMAAAVLLELHPKPHPRGPAVDRAAAARVADMGPGRLASG